MPEPSAEILFRAARGDRVALGRLIEQQQTYIYSIAMSLLRPPDEADATQETCLRLMRSLSTFRSDTRFTTWLYRVATTTALDFARRRDGAALSLDVADDDTSPVMRLVEQDPLVNPEQGFAERELREGVRRALAELPAAQRPALTLHYFDDMKYEEIGTVMDVPVNTVKSHILRGKARLATLLDPPGG